MENEENQLTLTFRTVPKGKSVHLARAGTSAGLTGPLSHREAWLQRKEKNLPDYQKMGHWVSEEIVRKERCDEDKRGGIPRELTLFKTRIVLKRALKKILTVKEKVVLSHSKRRKFRVNGVRPDQEDKSLRRIKKMGERKEGTKPFYYTN